MKRCDCLFSFKILAPMLLGCASAPEAHEGKKRQNKEQHLNAGHFLLHWAVFGRQHARVCSALLLKSVSADGLSSGIHITVASSWVSPQKLEKVLLPSAHDYLSISLLQFCFVFFSSNYTSVKKQRCYCHPHFVNLTYCSFLKNVSLVISLVKYYYSKKICLWCKACAENCQTSSGMN